MSYDALLADADLKLAQHSASPGPAM